MSLHTHVGQNLVPILPNLLNACSALLWCLRTGETCAIEAVPMPSSLGSEVLQCTGTSGGGAVLQSDELTAQLFNPPARYVLISTAGCVELEKRR
jgi:hypothetical protein